MKYVVINSNNPKECHELLSKTIEGAALEALCVLGWWLTLRYDHESDADDEGYSRRGGFTDFLRLASEKWR